MILRRYCYILLAFVIVSSGLSCVPHKNESEKFTAIADSCNKADNSLLALQYYIKGFIAAKNEGNDYLAMRCAGYISILYNSFGNVDGCLQYNKIGYDLSVKQNAVIEESAFLSNFVTYYCNIKDSVKARIYYDKLINLRMEKGKLKYEYFCIYEYARILRCVGNYAEAVKAHKKALAYAMRNNMCDIYVLFQNSEIGNLMILQHKYREAAEIGDSCLKEATRLGNKELMLNSYIMLADAYVGLHDKEKAYEYLEKHYSMNNKVYNMPKFFSLQNDLYQYEATIHKQRISKLTIAIIAIATIAAILILLVLIIFSKNRALRKVQIIVVNTDKEIIKQEKENRKTLSIENTQSQHVAHYVIPIDKKDELYHNIKNVLSDLSMISDTDFNINKLAEVTNSNVKYVSVVINEKFGKSFKNVLNEYRVKEACKMLSDNKYGHFTIRTIYENVGYRNAASFIRAFKNVKGMTPSIYQRICKENPRCDK